MRSRWDRRDARTTKSSLPHEGKSGRLKLTDARMLQWFARTLGPRWPVIVGALAAMAIAAALDTARPLVMKYLIDDGFLAQFPPAVSWALLMLLLIYVGGALMNWLRANLMNVLGQRLVHETRMQIFAHLQKLSLSYFHRNRTGDIISRLSNDVGAVEDMVVYGTDEVVTGGLRVLLAGIVMFGFLNWQLALLALAPMPIFAVAIVLFARYVRPMYRKIRDELGVLNARLEERIAGSPVTKAFAREDHELEVFGDTSLSYYDASVRAIRVRAAFFPMLHIIASAGVLLVLWRGGYMIAGGEGVTVGTMMAFVMYLQQFYMRLSELFRASDMYNRALAALARLFQILDEVPEVDDAPDAIELRDIRGQVEFDSVCFRYQTGEQVLQDVSVSAEPGETVAVVGRSGAGKTSLVNLIARFYDPDSGCVKVDGHDVRQVTQTSLRKQIAMVLQETFLFDASVRENVGYGRPGASDSEIQAACKAAHAHDFICQLPEGYATQVGERGVKLSGGQKQRIAVARALLANPRILILDEATSLVDSEAEEIIQQALDNLMKDRTTFIIAHRLSTVRKANKIVVIDGGMVVEEADHDTLIRRQGLYAEMYERQFRSADSMDFSRRDDMLVS